MYHSGINSDDPTEQQQNSIESSVLRTGSTTITRAPEAESCRKTSRRRAGGM